MAATTPFPQPDDTQVIKDLHRVFELQQKSFVADGDPDATLRKDRISRVIEMVIKHAGRFTEATHADYGSRHPDLGRAMDVAGTIDGLKADRASVSKFIKGERRHSAFPIGLLGGRSRIHYEPLGVIGNISPWNFPINLSFSMLGAAFGAGNRVMIKPSDQTPITSQAIAEAVAEYFDESELAAFAGGMDLAIEFPKLPYDHLMFTGSPALAKIICAEAAKHLTPVTLELGGKSPVIVGRSADLGEAARRIMWGKSLNGGQVCLSPDYGFIPKGSEDEFIAAASDVIREMFPTMVENDEYINFVNDRHYQRVKGYLDDATAKGARVVQVNSAGETFTDECRKLPVTFVLGVTDEMTIGKEEIFGPVFLVRSYEQFDEAIDFINARPKPLALYYFGSDDGEWQTVLNRTSSGGVVKNDVIVHFMQHDLPFGGVGNSGTGRYHGIEGFKRFSNPRGIYEQSNIAAKAIRLALNFPMKDLHKKVVASKIR